MSSEIIEFRDQIIEHIRECVPELASVDWYDGLFDETDVDEWIVQAPAAYVAAVSIPKNDPHQTGEMNATLRIIVTVVTEDKYSARDNDSQNWALMEKIATLANQNKFGNSNAAPAMTPMLKRLRDPVLRREGVALGVVEWDSGYTFGRNRTFEHLFIYDPDTGERITKTPTMNAFLGIGEVRTPTQTATESLDLRKPDPAFPWPSEDES
jgi:phage gp37-like protein